MDYSKWSDADLKMSLGNNGTRFIVFTVGLFLCAAILMPWPMALFSAGLFIYHMWCIGADKFAKEAELKKRGIE